ncbi:MAG: hypothetical protein MUE50_13525 [Pirellulaceae bacterium]|jgi:hypothetical protein|nr:hypothetical protein [Pirellulaceae bacterium]
MKVESREYKLLVNHESFVDAPSAVKAIWDEIEEAVKTLATVRAKSKLDEKEVRRIAFLDTPDHTLRRNGLVFRRRAVDESAEYTLKCRSEDRYLAAGTDVRAADHLESEQKLEEDIAPPFRCRFSHSATMAAAGSGDIASEKTPKNLREAAALFPVLGTLSADGRPCAPETALEVVNNIIVDECVWKGGKLVFEGSDGEEAGKASVALILWTRGKQGRPAVAELSFRLKDSEERFSRELARAARSTYTLLQRLDCSRPGGMTKTEYIYRDASSD